MPINSISPKTYSLHPLLLLTSGFATGIIAAKYLATDWIVLAAIFAVTFFVAAILRGKDGSMLTLFLAFLAAGGLCFLAEVNGVAESRLKLLYDRGAIASGDPIDLEGVVAGGLEPTGDGYFIEIASEKIRYKGEVSVVSGNVRIFVPVDNGDAERDLNELKILHGSRLLVACRPVREEHFQNPGVRSKRESLDELGIDATATLKSPLLIENLGNPSDWNPLAFVFDWRRKLIDSFRENLAPRTASVMIASLLGDKYFIDKGTADVFREGGTFHILVISGLHITFLGGLMLLLVSRLTRRRVLQFVICSGFLWSYTLAVGADIPVVRASVVFTLLLFSRIVYRTPSLLNTLGACALVLLVYRPSSLFTASFQLTFVSVGAIVAIAFPLIEKVRSIGRWMPSTMQPFPPIVSTPIRRFAESLYWTEAQWDHQVRRHVWSANLFKSPFVSFDRHTSLQTICAYLFEGLIISLIIQICLLPLSVYHFHRVSFAGVFLNLWVGVLLAAESFVAVFAVLTSQISQSLAFPLFRAADLINSLLLFFPELLSGRTFTGMRLPAYSGAGFLFYFAYFAPLLFLAFALYRWEQFRFTRPSTSRRTRNNIIAAGALTVLSLIILTHPMSEPDADGKLRVDFLDVGQGDSALVTFPDGQTLLVDGGGRIDSRRSTSDEQTESLERDVPGIGEAVVSRFLWHKGYSDIDYVLATHSHADHVQGLAEIAANFDINNAFVGRSSGYASEFDSFSQIIEKRNIERRPLAKGDSFEIAGVKVEVLWPDADAFYPPASHNDESVVIKLTFGSRSILLTGDMERRTEAALVASGVLTGADVVKVPHHGSRTSSTPAFVDSARAQYAIISVGRRSTYGHPHPEVVDRWRNAGAEVITTGERGTITVITDGSRLWVESYVP